MEKTKMLTKSKNGNGILILLTLVFIIVFILLFILYIFFFQFNSEIINIKTDLFYIAQNVLGNLDKYELGFDNYVFNLQDIKKDIEHLINLNYINKNSNNEKYIEITNIKYYMKGQKDEISKVILSSPTIHIELRVKVKPIVLKQYINERNVTIHEDIKMSLMEN